MTGRSTRHTGDGERSVRRRRLLAAVAGGVGAALAGCTGGETATPTDSATDTATPTATDSPNPTDSPSSTETATPAVDLPATGEAIPELGPVEEAVRTFMDDNGVTAGALGVARDGEVVAERGYGWADEGQSAPTPPDAGFRIASLTKSLTAAAVRSLYGDELSPETRLLDRLDVEPHGGLGDERLREVTVQHLLDHAGGWDARQDLDPLFAPFRIADELGIEEPPTTRDVARFTLGRSLQFDPGSRHVYSNVGYALLGLLVEDVTGTPFPEYARETLFGGDPPVPLYEGHTHPDERRAGEVHYRSARECPDAVSLNPNRSVPCADGGFVLSAAGGAGELVTGVRTLLSFAADHRLDGFATSENPEHATAFGSLPGGFSMLQRREDGVSVAVLFNYRGRTATGFARVRGAVEDAIAGIDGWP